MKIALLSICLVFTLSVQAQGKTFNELYKQECVRLRTMLEKGMGGGLKVLMRKAQKAEDAQELQRAVDD